MKKILVLVMMLAIIVVPLSGCGGETGLRP